MKLLRLADGAQAHEPTVVCLGFFDGVHLGHLRLILAAREIARRDGLATCVHTFDRMPAKVMQPDTDILELTPLPEKAALLKGLGVELLAVSPFDSSMMHMRAAQFFEDVLLQRLMARHIVAGYHHRFGFRGEAGTEALKTLCERAGTALTVIAPVTLKTGELISSTAIRRAIASGDTDAAARMLGRPYQANRGETAL